MTECAFKIYKNSQQQQNLLVVTNNNKNELNRYAQR